MSPKPHERLMQPLATALWCATLSALSALSAEPNGAEPVAHRGAFVQTAQEEGVMDPTPLASLEQALARVKQWGWVAEAAEPVEGELVGAITKGKDGRLGFMPTLQHYRSAEHWFMEGVDEAVLQGAYDKNQRCFVRLRGKFTLLGAYGADGIDFYGDAWGHRRSPSPVKGFHERVYRLQVQEVLWARTPEQYAEGVKNARALVVPIKGMLDAKQYAQADAQWKKALAAYEALGLDLNHLRSEQEYTAMMALLASDPKRWNQQDLKQVARALVGKPYQPYVGLGGSTVMIYKPGGRDGAGLRDEKGREQLRELVKTWPKETQEALGEHLVEAFMEIESPRCREQILTLFSSIESGAVRDLENRFNEAKAKMVEIHKDMAKLQKQGDYKGILNLDEAAAPFLKLTMDLRYLGNRKFWMGPTQRLLAIEQAFGDPQKRMRVLWEKLKESCDSDSGRLSSSIKPRFNEQIIKRFIPQLAAPEKNDLEKHLIEYLKDPDYDKRIGQLLLAAEVLASIAGPEGTECLIELNERGDLKFKHWMKPIMMKLGPGGAEKP